VNLDDRTGGQAMARTADSEHQTKTTAVEEVPDNITLREHIDQIDAEILRLIQLRTRISRTIGESRVAAGGPRIVLSREKAVFAHFRALGSDGSELATLLLRLGRGRLGRT
jgi:chorismate mutase